MMGIQNYRQKNSLIQLYKRTNQTLNLNLTDGSRNYLLFEPSEESTQIVSEDDHDVFNIRLEEDGNDYLI